MEAVKLIEERKFGTALILNGPNVDTVPIEDAVRSLRLVDPESQIVATARDLGIIFGDRPAEALMSDHKKDEPAGKKPARKACKSKEAK